MLVEVAAGALLARDDRSARALQAILATLDDRLGAAVWPEAFRGFSRPILDYGARRAAS
jgi:hypothetical protein